MRFGILLRQVLAVVHYTVVTLPRRARSAFVLLAGMAGITAVQVGLFSIADGIRTALTAGTDDRVAVIVQDGSFLELDSRLDRETIGLLSNLPQVDLRDSRPVASPEVVAVVSRERREGNRSGALLLRGVTDFAFETRPGVEMVRGRRFRDGHDEAIVGTSANRLFADLDLGETLSLGNRDLEIVGAFSSGGGSAESEIWTSGAVLREVFALGPAHHSLRVRLRDPDLLWDLEGETISDPRLGVIVRRESDFYREQSQVMTLFVEGFGWFVVALMAGAVGFVTLNTAFGAVAARRREIGALRALGYCRLAIFGGFLTEMAILAAVGASLGALVAYAAFDGLRTSTLNLTSLSQLVFSFRVGPGTAVVAVAVTTGIGVLAGAIPALSAVRRPPFLLVRGA